MANAGRILAGIATLGASEAIAQPLEKSRNKADTAISNIQKRKIQDLNLGQGVGTDRVATSGQSISGAAPKGKVTTAGYAGPQESAGYITGLQKALGVQGPKSTIDATREAATRKLEQGTLEQAIRDQTQLAAQGQSTGARSQALSSLRGQTLAGQKAQLEADLQQNEAGRLDAYEARLLGMAQEQGRALTSADQEAARAQTQGSFTNAQAEAQRQLQQAEMALRSGESLNTEEYRRRMAEYQNALDKIQQANTADVLALQEASGRRAAITGGIGAVLGAAGQVGSAAMGRA